MSPQEEQPISPGGNGDAALKVQVKPVRRTRLPSLKRLSSRLKVHKSDNPPVVAVSIAFYLDYITSEFCYKHCCCDCEYSFLFRLHYK